MSDPSDTRNIAYDPLPLTNDDHHSNTLYNAPPSPDPRISSYHTPPLGPNELPTESGIPVGAAQPRFLGQALYDAPMRDSIASSHRTGGGSEYNSSVYALNDPAAPGQFGGGYRDDPRDSYYAGGAVPQSPHGATDGRMLEEKRTAYAPPRTKSRRKVMIVAVIVALLLLILAIIIPVYFFVIRPSNNERSTGGGSAGSSTGGHSAHPSSTAPGSSPSSAAVTGGDGSLVTMEDGTTFTYKNPFGGFWHLDESQPFSGGGKAQSWTPALNETFNYGIDKIKGVNFGGWLNTEPFISPALYEKYSNNPTPVIDEWTLSIAMRADAAGGGINQMEDHYKTFITEKDFADVAGAGLNFVRIPIGYWAIEVLDGEPFLAKVSWTYFLKAIKWARKYGLRINLDLHGLPGSQNGWNHSGKWGTIGFLNGPMGFVNAQRSLDYIRIFAEFISQPQYKDVVTIFGIMNEPQGGSMGKDQLTRFYLEAYNIIRTAGGTGEGNGPYVSIHDGFFPRSDWVDVFPNGDRIALDTHPYLAFGGQSADPISTYARTPCTSWGGGVNTSMGAFGLTTAGEFSNAVTDCGLFLNGVGLGIRYEGTYFDGVWPRIGDCTPWTDWQNYDAATKQAIRNFALASMDALQDYFFWNWKIGNSSVSGKVETPAWSYQLGLENGWMPTDPRDATGTCGNMSPWSPPLQSWQTGGTGAGNIPANVLSNLAWPPTNINGAGAVADLPQYTPTGPIPTLPAPTYSAPSSQATIDAGNGWANSADTQGMYVAIPGCTYLDPWVNPSTAPPPVCAAAPPARREEAPKPLITTPPAA